MKVIIFGATGMVGSAVLRECLRDPGIDRVLSIGRGSTHVKDAKLIELLRADMFDATPTDDLRGYDACFFCLGVSSAGMNEADYTHLTYDLTIAWARTLASVNPAMTFVYVSGAGTGGKAMWAKVKARTERDLLEIFPSAYMFRLSALRPMNDEVSKTRWTRISYSLFSWLLPLIQRIAPNAVITTEELGRAMIRVAREGAPKHILENADMRRLA